MDFSQNLPDAESQVVAYFDADVLPGDPQMARIAVIEPNSNRGASDCGEEPPSIGGGRRRSFESVP